MEKLLSLIKIDLLNTFGLSSLVHSMKDRRTRWQFIILAIAFLSLIPSYVMFVKGLSNIYVAYDQLGQRSYFLQLGIFLAQMAVFLFGILYVMSKYYFANDLNQLVPLPIKPSHILGSKFVSLMVSEYLTSLPITLPFIIIYGVRGREGILYWLCSVLVILSLPVIPLVLSSILVMIFMKHTNIKGKKDLIRIIGAVLFIIGLVFFQLKIQDLVQKSLMEGEDFFLRLASDSNLLVKRLGLIFPPSMIGSLSLIYHGKLLGFIYLIIFLGLSTAGYFLMIFLAENIFFDGLIGNIEVTSRKSGKKIDLNRQVKVSKPYIALAKKELIMLFKTPVYLINSIGGVIFIPIILIFSFSRKDESLIPLLNLLKYYEDYLVLGATAVLMLVANLNAIGSTSFSREGKCFWIQRSLPIGYKDQIIGRVLASLLVQLIGVISLVASFNYIISLSLKNIILITLLGLLGSIPITQIGLVIDILRPLLVWDNPQRAMKQNLNVLISLGVGSLFVLLLGYGSWRLLNKLSINYILSLITIILLASSILLYYLLKRLLARQFTDLE